MSENLQKDDTRIRLSARAPSEGQQERVHHAPMSYPCRPEVSENLQKALAKLSARMEKTLEAEVDLANQEANLVELRFDSTEAIKAVMIELDAFRESLAEGDKEVSPTSQANELLEEVTVFDKLLGLEDAP